MAEPRPSQEQRLVNLALQGGGAHGAFTWGVLDRLLEDGRIAIEAISGTSAGAINAAVLAQGYLKGGAAAARAELDRFWHRLSELGWLSPVHRGLYERAMGSWNIDASPASVFVDQLSRVVSPYQFNPLNLSPLRDLLAGMLDVEALAAPDAIKLFITATNVRTGKARIFERHEVTLDALLASACLPQVFQAVVIEGEPYWDGGYMGNPSLWPLIYGCGSRDVIIVEINPLTRPGVPRTASEITNRLNEITFNASLMREIRAIAFVERLVDADDQHPEMRRLKKMLIHMIEAEEAMERLGVASKMNTDLDFLLYLKGLGQRTAGRWLEKNFAALNHYSSLDIRKVFL
ncbi:MAG TPA: patatin-like phospholipase family protein [Stellaceae bacterium]|nr:patatin-like phospholipase family protein [Stellaceae bacterium]